MSAYMSKMKWHIQKSDLMCPECDESQPDVHELELQLFHSEIIECYHCMKKFKAEMEICYTTHAVCSDNGLECEFEDTHIPNFQLCNNCEKCKRVGDP